MSSLKAYVFKKLKENFEIFYLRVIFQTDVSVDSTFDWIFDISMLPRVLHYFDIFWLVGFA